MGARLADLVDLIATHSHETLGVSSATIADAINKQIVAPLVNLNFPRRRMKLGIVKQTIDHYLRVPLIRASLPKWWQSFAGYETWVHDGTCGHAKDWRWLLEHWPSLATGYRAPFLRAGQSMRETAKILVKLGFHADDYLRCVEELKKKLIEHVEAGDRESTRAELGVRDFPGYARRYLETGHMKRSVRMGENAGINALTGALTAWIPAPLEAEVTQEPPEGIKASQSGDLELSGPVWGPSPTREFFRQMRAQRKERPVRDKFRVVIDVPLRENAEVTELVCQQIATIVKPGLPEGVAVKILCNEGDDIVKVPRVGEDEASTLTPEPGEPTEAASGDEIKADGTAPDLEEEAEAPN